MTPSNVKKRYEAAMADTPLGAADQLDELVTDMGNHFDEKSERWQESEAGDDWQQVQSEIEERAVQMRDAAEFEPEFN